MRASTPFSESRNKMLQDPELAAMYLEESLAEGDIETFKLALKHVAEAHVGGITTLSRITHLNRVSLYRTFSEKGNPSLETLTKILNALGLRIGVTPQTPSLIESAIAKADKTDIDATTHTSRLSTGDTCSEDEISTPG
jgi:probable addiction module antidote protein